jgi:nicotinamide-nucleotide amidase
MDSSDDTLRELAVKLGERLEAGGLTVTTAESCTGGWIAKCITDIAGSSGWFDRGFVTYSNEAKVETLGVSESLLAEHGAVSEDAVRAMAEGALERSRADLAVSVSGVAGPGGGTEDKPVGTVWFCWQRRGGEPIVRVVPFDGDRETVRRESVKAALWGLIGMAGGN